MSPVLCVRVACQCGEGMVWTAQVSWLAEEGLTLAPMQCQRLPVPRDARDVTGLFTVRCPRCFQFLPPVPILRARVAAGAGTVFELPAGQEDPLPRPPGSAPPDAKAASPSRLSTREGRRARRARMEAGLPGQVSASFPVTILDLSTSGLCAEHTQQVDPGALFTLCLQLPGYAEALRLQGRAKWTQPHRIEQTFGARCTVHRSGFQFLKVGPEALAALEGYVADWFAGRASAGPAWALRASRVPRHPKATGGRPGGLADRGPHEGMA